MEVHMRKRATTALLVLLLSGVALPQAKPQKPSDDQPIRISTELVQVDVVVTDKTGRVVKGLTKDDFTLYDSGKKQQINFFEFVNAIEGNRSTGKPGQIESVQPVSPQGLSGAEVRRIFA